VKQLTFSLVRGTAWTSRLIGYFGAGYYSHIDVLTTAGMLRGARSDWHAGVPPGYQDRPWGYEDWIKQTLYTIDVAPAQWDEYWKFSDAQLGKPYDKRGLVRTFVFGREWRDEDSWWCSEEVAANLEAAGVVSIPPEVKAVEPGDCAFLFAGLGALRKEV
jgi:hypothetical protein